MSILDIETGLKTFLPPKLSQFLIQNNKSFSENGTSVPLKDILPLQGTPGVAPQDISENMKQFWVPDLKYTNILSNVSKFHSVVRENPELLDEILTFSEKLYALNNFLYCYFYLKIFIMNQTESESEYKAFWGLISSHTLLYLDTKQNGEQVLESENKPLIVYELDTLNKRIESSTTLTRWTRVKHRIWIMHYSIAIYRWALSYHIPVRASQANIEDSYPSTVETGIVSICIGEPYEKFQDKSESSNYLPIIQLGAPHLMPYVVVAFIISLTQNKGNYKKFIPSISKAIDCIFPNTDKSSSLHPVVKIAQSLFITYDFDSALEALKEVKELKDIFLSQHIDSFVKSANQLIATAYANVHSILRLSEFLSKFNLKREEINSVIEDFKVDDELDKIWVTHTPENIHHYIKEKVDDILKPKEKQQYHGDRTYGDRSYGDRSYGSYGYGDRSYGDRSYGEGKYYKKYDNQGSQKAQ